MPLCRAFAIAVFVDAIPLSPLPCRLADMDSMSDQLRDVEVRAPVPKAYKTILTPEALVFLAYIARRHTPRVEQLLARRRIVQAKYDAGACPDFLPETQHIRDGDWKVRVPVPCS